MYKFSCLAVIMTALFVACSVEEEKDFLFASSLPEDFVFGKLEKDTTVTFIVRTQGRWNAELDADWCSISQKEGSDLTSVVLSVTPNKGERFRTANIDFHFAERNEMRSVVVRQFGSEEKFEIEIPSLELMSQKVDTSVVVFCNMPFETSVNYLTDSGWIGIGESEEISSYKYKVHFSTLEENNGRESKRAEIVFSAKNSENEEKGGKVSVSQMYSTDPIECSFDDDLFNLSWTQSTDPSITYYELRVYDNLLNPLEVKDVTGVTSCDLGSLDILTAQTPYVGPMQVEIVGLENAGDEYIVAKTDKLPVHSHFMDGEGSESKPYVLANPRHLNNFITLLAQVPEKASSCFRLDSDIVLTTPTFDMDGVGSNFYFNESFGGVFDGNGHSISNIVIVSKEKRVAPFAILSDKGTVKNLTVYVGKIKSTEAEVTAGLVGMLYGTIEGCEVRPYDENSIIVSDSPMIDATGNNNNVLDAYLGFTGGVSGTLEGQILNCGNYCPVLSPVSVGGIAGGCHSLAAANGLIENCYNFGDLYLGNPQGYEIPGGESVTPAYVGGHVGTVAGGIVGKINLSSSKIKIKTSYNAGNIYAEQGCIAGIGGRLLSCTIEDCYNAGNIVCTHDKVSSSNPNSAQSPVYIGGIVAWFGGWNFSSSRTLSVGKITFNKVSYLGMAFGQVNKAANYDVVYADQENDYQAIGRNNYTPITDYPEDNPTFIKCLTYDQCKDLSNFWPNFATNWQNSTDPAYPYPILKSNPHKINK